MADVKVSDFSQVSYIHDTDVIYLIQEDGQGGLLSCKGTVGQLKQHIDGLFVTGTLTAGQTSITLSDAAITTASNFDFYTDTFGVNPTNVSVSTGVLTLTFPAQQSDLSVKVRVF